MVIEVITYRMGRSVIFLEVDGGRRDVKRVLRCM